MKNAARIITALLVAVLMIGTVSAEFVPSIMQKPAPEIVHKDQNEQGDPVIIIRNDEEKVEKTGPVTDLIVTPISEREQASEAIQEKLENAHKQIAEAEDLTVLTPDVETVLEEMNAELPEEVEKAAVEDLVVRDLIDVSLSQDMLDVLLQPGNTITVSFEIAVAPEEMLIVLHNLGGEDWEVIPRDQVIVNDDGTVDVTFTSLSPVAFVVRPVEEPAETEAAETVAAETEAAETVAEPVISAEATSNVETKSNTGLYVGIGVVAAAVVALVVILLLKKKN